MTLITYTIKIDMVVFDDEGEYEDTMKTYVTDKTAIESWCAESVRERNYELIKVEIREKEEDA